MGHKLSDQDKQLYARVDEVLHYIWDPIRVCGIPQARDEYDIYLPQIFSLVKTGHSADEIAKHLDRIVVERMGMSSSLERALEVANILLDWREMLDYSTGETP